MDVACYGRDGPSIIMLHGIQGTRAAWESIASLMAEENRCVLPNFAGRGALKLQYSFESMRLKAFAESLHELIQSQRQSPIILAGWSLGVSVIFEYVRYYGIAGVDAMVLISGTPSMDECEWFSATEQEKLLEEIVAREQRLQLKEAAHPEAVAACWQLNKHHNHYSILSTISCPVLIIHGLQDEDCPFSHAQLCARHIQSSQLISIEEGRHTLLASHAPFIARAMQIFIGENCG